MSVEVGVENGILRVVFRGAMTVSDFDVLGPELEAVEATAARVPHRITDLRPVTRMEVTYRDVMGLAARRLNRTLPNDVRSAIVTGDAAVRSAAQVFEVFNRNPRITVRLFDDMDAAERWIAGSAGSPAAGGGIGAERTVDGPR